MDSTISVLFRTWTCLLNIYFEIPILLLPLLDFWWLSFELFWEMIERSDYISLTSLLCDFLSVYWFLIFLREMTLWRSESHASSFISGFANSFVTRSAWGLLVVYSVLDSLVDRVSFLSSPDWVFLRTAPMLSFVVYGAALSPLNCGFCTLSFVT